MGCKYCLIALISIICECLLLPFKVQCYYIVLTVLESVLCYASNEMEVSDFFPKNISELFSLVTVFTI